QYDVLVDRLAHLRSAPSEFISQICYGQLQRISHFLLPAIPTHAIMEPTHIVLVAIEEKCKIRPGSDRLGLGIHFFTPSPGAVFYVDLTTVKCVVGRVKDGLGQEAIIDRTGTVTRGLYADDEHEEA
ncbi:uncharacterized protein BXZ73DRAFT_52204, partial [Epithele typhae]|uniref:uncharacterized protein n=1 Tax=Epithele typhae TaxID=378194 RepID=UPI0020074BE0